jgi:hypothetical protein
MAEKRLKSGSLSLCKVVASNNVEVGRYESDSGGFVGGGPLVLDTGEVDELVVLLTVTVGSEQGLDIKQ